MSTISLGAYLGCAGLSIASLFPAFFTLIKGGRAFLPFFVYGVSIWVFLIIGVLAYNERLGIYHPFTHEYFLVLIFAVFPLYFGGILACGSKSGKSIPVLESERCQTISYFVPLGIALVIFLGVISYVSKSGLPPLWKIFYSGQGLSGLSGNEIYFLRKEATYTEDFSDSSFFFFSLPFVLFICSYYLYLKKNMTFSVFSLVVFYVFVVGSAFMHKAALAVFFMSAIFVYIYLFGFKASRVFGISAGLVGFLFLGFFLYYQDEGVSYLFELIIYRIVGSYSFNTQFALDLFSDPDEFLWGWSMIRPMGIGGGGGNLPGLIMEKVYGIEDGNASLSTFGHWYANFGWLGVALCTFLVTVWLCFLAFSHKFFKTHLLTLVVWLYFSISVLDFTRMEFFAAIGLKDLFFAMLAVFVFYFLRDISVSKK